MDSGTATLDWPELVRRGAAVLRTHGVADEEAERVAEEFLNAIGEANQ